jgi:hypothetical protein
VLIPSSTDFSRYSSASAPTEGLVRPSPFLAARWLMWLIAPGLLIASVLFTWVQILPLRQALPLMLASLATALPGVVICRRTYGAWLPALLAGPALGYALTSLIMLALWTLGYRDLKALVIAVVLSTAGSALLSRPLAGLLQAPTLTRRDLQTLCFLLLLVPIIVGRPFARVGEPMPDGEAWRAYFTADFVWAVAVVAEVGKGDLPPQNPFRLGDRLHYYWLAHVVPTVEYGATPRSIEIRQVLLANAVLSGLLLVCFLYFFARHFVSSSIAAALAVVFTICCHSFEGLQQIVALWQIDRPLDLVKYINIDGVTRWVFRGMPVDGLQRLLLYQPQHQLGYALGLLALLTLRQAHDRLGRRTMAVVGGMLSLSLLMSSFSALMITVVASAFAAIEVVRQRRWKDGVIAAGIAALPLFAAVVFADSLQYVEHGGALVSMKVNRIALASWPTVIALSFGATMLVGGAGAIMALRAREAGRFLLLGLMFIVCWLFYFLVDVRDHQDVYVGWRAGHLMFIAAIPLVAIAFERLSTFRPAARWSLAGAAALVALCAVPTTAIDLYNTQDIGNRAMAAGFRWTVLLTADEKEALDWIRWQTPETAIVQVEPFVRGADTWAYVPAFGQRRMAAGIPISMIPLARYITASEKIRDIYLAGTAHDARLLARRRGVEYLVIGPPESEAYPQLAPMLDEAPELWRAVFQNKSVRIYRPL